MENIEFIKMHGLGNDFVIIDQRINKIKISKKIINKLTIPIKGIFVSKRFNHINWSNRFYLFYFIIEKIFR